MAEGIGGRVRGQVHEWREVVMHEWDRNDLLKNFGPFIMLAILIGFFGLTSDRFLTYSNVVSSLLRNSIILLLVALAGTYPILQQSIDLSVAAIVSTSAIATAIFAGQFGLFALILGILTGAFIGLFNGVVFTKLKLPSFLVTLGTLEILGGIQLIVTQGVTIPFTNETMAWLAAGTIIPEVPNLVLWGLAFYGISIFIAFRTRFGRYTYALGENEQTVKLSGVRVDRYKIGAFVVSGFLCGVAGALLAARLTAASPDMGGGLLLQSIAAIVIGGTALTGGVGGPHRTIIGVLVIAVLANGMNLIGIDPFQQRVILGVVVIVSIALAIDRDKIGVIK